MITGSIGSLLDSEPHEGAANCWNEVIQSPRTNSRNATQFTVLCKLLFIGIAISAEVSQFCVVVHQSKQNKSNAYPTIVTISMEVLNINDISQFSIAGTKSKRLIRLYKCFARRMSTCVKTIFDLVVCVKVADFRSAIGSYLLSIWKLDQSVGEWNYSVVLYSRHPPEYPFHCVQNENTFFIR